MQKPVGSRDGMFTLLGKRIRISLKMTVSVLIDLLCKMSLEGSWKAPNILSNQPFSLCFSFFFLLSNKMHFYLHIKMNQLTCKITVLVLLLFFIFFLHWRKLCSMQTVFQTFTGEKQQTTETNKQVNQKEKKNIFPFNSLRYDSVFN